MLKTGRILTIRQRTPKYASHKNLHFLANSALSAQYSDQLLEFTTRNQDYDLQSELSEPIMHQKLASLVQALCLVGFRDWSRPPPTEPCNRRRTLGIIRCSRQISNEVAHILYGEPVFYFHSECDLKCFILKIGDKNAGTIRKLALVFPLRLTPWSRLYAPETINTSKEWLKFAEVLARAINLRNLLLIGDFPLQYRRLQFRKSTRYTRKVDV